MIINLVIRRRRRSRIRASCVSVNLRIPYLLLHVQIFSLSIETLHQKISIQTYNRKKLHRYKGSPQGHAG